MAFLPRETTERVTFSSIAPHTCSQTYYSRNNSQALVDTRTHATVSCTKELEKTVDLISVDNCSNV